MKLVEAVKKVKSRKQHQFAPEQLAALMQNLQLQTKTGIEKIALPIGEGYSMVSIQDICYLHAESNYTWVYMKNGEKHLIAKTLKEIEDLLDFPYFYRPHKSYLVNLNHIEKYVRGQGGYLVTISNNQIPVSRSQKNELIEILKKGI
jgi:two-component system LytT family response regulator